MQTQPSAPSSEAGVLQFGIFVVKFVWFLSSSCRLVKGSCIMDSFMNVGQCRFYIGDLFSRVFHSSSQRMVAAI